MLPEPAPPHGRAILRDVLIVAAVGAAIWVAHRLGRIVLVLVLVLAMFLAYVIAPLVDLVQHPFTLRGRARRLPRGVAIGIIYVVLTAGLGAATVVIWPSAAEKIDAAIASVPGYTESFRVVAITVAVLHDPALALWTAGFLTVLRVVEDYVIYPRLIGRDIHLHPLVVIVAVLAGVELDGIAGIFIAVPVVALVTVGARNWLEWRARDLESEPAASV